MSNTVYLVVPQFLTCVRANTSNVRVEVIIYISRFIFSDSEMSVPSLGCFSCHTAWSESDSSCFSIWVSPQELARNFPLRDFTLLPLFIQLIIGDEQWLLLIIIIMGVGSGGGERCQIQQTGVLHAFGKCSLILIIASRTTKLFLQLFMCKCFCAVLGKEKGDKERELRLFVFLHQNHPVKVKIHTSLLLRRFSIKHGRSFTSLLHKTY